MEGTPGYYTLGGDTPIVSYSVMRNTRRKIVERLRREALVSLDGAFVVLEGGKACMRHDTDHEPLFRQESYFHYTFGVKEPDCYGAINVSTGESVLFIPRLPESYATWMGRIKLTVEFKDNYLVDMCYYTDEIAEKLKSLGCVKVLIIHGKNTDSDQFHPGASFTGMKQFDVDKQTLFPVIQQCRVVKLPEELDLMRKVARISAEGHKEVIKTIRPGHFEYQMESTFQHYVYHKGGCRFLSYTCICCSGPNSSVLHYGHAGAPNSRLIKDGDMLMFDMGAEYFCYGSDISRSFPANGKFSTEQKEIYLSVLASQQAVMDAMKAGVSWPDMHRLATRVVCEQLKKYDFLRGDVDEMMKKHVGALFMPHGLGHLLGIDTHDVGGYPEGMERSTLPGLKSLRFGGILEENMVVTVEPGIYFIRHLLEPALKDPHVAHFLNTEKITKFLDFGGVRIEDDVIVLKDGIENMSAACPRSIEEIEALMASSKHSDK